MFLLAVLLASFTLVSPTPNPSLKEILLAHSVATEFKSTHLSPGIQDVAWFKSAHSILAPNPPQSLAAKADDQGLLKAIFNSFSSSADDTTAKTSMNSLSDEGKDSLRMAVKMTADIAKTDPSFHQDSLDLIKYAKAQGLDTDLIIGGKSDASSPAITTSTKKSSSANAITDKRMTLLVSSLGLVASFFVLFL